MSASQSTIILQLPPAVPGQFVTIQRLVESLQIHTPDGLVVAPLNAKAAPNESFWCRGFRWYREETGRPILDPLADWLQWNERQS